MIFCVYHTDSGVLRRWSDYPMAIASDESIIELPRGTQLIGNKVVDGKVEPHKAGEEVFASFTLGAAEQEEADAKAADKQAQLSALKSSVVASALTADEKALLADIIDDKAAAAVAAADAGAVAITPPIGIAPSAGVIK